MHYVCRQWRRTIRTVRVTWDRFAAIFVAPLTPLSLGATLLPLPLSLSLPSIYNFLPRSHFYRRYSFYRRIKIETWRLQSNERENIRRSGNVWFSVSLSTLPLLSPLRPPLLVLSLYLLAVGLHSRLHKVCDICLMSLWARDVNETVKLGSWAPRSAVRIWNARCTKV